MAGCKKTIPCDYDKLYGAFKKRGLTIKEAAKEIGYSETGIRDKDNSRKITKPLSLLLESYFNIKPDDYAPDPETPVAAESIEAPKNDIREEFEAIKDDLYKLVYGAVYEAVKQAWSE